MKLKIKYLGLIIGLISVIISFLFIGRHHLIYILLLLIGLGLSFVFYLSILLSKEKLKSKLLWTFVVIFSVLIQWLTEPILVKSSYLIFLKCNQTELTAVNKILKEKGGKIVIFNGLINDDDGILTQIEKDNLLKLRDKLDVYIISKSDSDIYYGLWGLLDVRLGIIYSLNDTISNESNQRLTENWYMHNKNN